MKIGSVTLSRETNCSVFPFFYSFIYLLNHLDCEVEKKKKGGALPMKNLPGYEVNQHVTDDEVRGTVQIHSSPCSTSQEIHITLNRCLCRLSSICLHVKQCKVGSAAELLERRVLARYS